eukprot:scaffold25303_cov117-Cylindrotheca_fusiformis.AAC.5
MSPMAIELGERNEDYLTWADNVASPIVIMDIDGTVVGWNQTAEDSTRISRQEIMHQSLSSYLQENSRERFEVAAREIETGSRDCSICNLSFPSFDGRQFRVKIAAQKDPISGQVSGMVCFFMYHIDKQEPPSSGVKVSKTSKLALEIVPNPASKKMCVAAQETALEHLLSTANLPIFGVDESGRVNEWNCMMAQITGYSKREALERKFVETFIKASFQASAEEVLDEALLGKETTNFNVEVKAKKGIFRSFLMNVTTRRCKDDRIVGAVAFAQDVTEGLKRYREVESDAKELRQLSDTINAPVFGVDCSLNVNYWNAKSAEIIGITKEDALGSSFVENFIAPSMKASVQDILTRALQGEGTTNYHIEFLTSTKETRHLLVNASTRRDTENNVVGVVGFAQDVTEAVYRDRAVASMAAELRQLIETANAPIFGIDVIGNVNEWNGRTAEITGYSREEAFGKPLVETFIADGMKDRVKRVLADALVGQETSNYELEFKSKTGSPVFLLVNATTRRDPLDVVVGVVGVAQDVTDDRKHSQALREMQYLQASQDAKVETERNMTAYFAHELRNPLGAIDSALSAMPDDLPEAARSLVSGMQLCTGFMASIMNNLLDVRKMEEGKMVLLTSPMSLKKILSNVHRMLMPSVRPGVELIKICETRNRDWVIGDSHRVQQIMTNVVTNAIKYTVSGSITLYMGWENDQIKFECIDTGPGIPKNQQEKLFQRFVQRGGAPGTGLGLAIAKHLVDLTGGSIRFESDPTIKAGTTCVVHLNLPVCNEPNSRIVQESDILIQEPVSFLIIDDIKMNRMMLRRRILKGIAPNATVKEAATGEEALEICGAQKFDVIVVDQYMEEAGGVMVGTDVIFAMRRMRINSVIIGCSGNDMGTQFAEAGANWVWQKPMPPNKEIILEIRRLLKERCSACPG